MDLYNIFLDESGNSDIKSYIDSPYFTICGVLISENTRSLVKKSFENLKRKYFKDKNYVLHSVKLRRKLRYIWIKTNKIVIEDFAKDLDKVLRSHPFFLLLVTVNKEKAFKRSWDKKTLYDKVYRSIIGNLIKFLVARNAVGKMYSEACTVEQDIFLYKGFFHYLANGLDRIGITSEMVKSHLTSLSYVTKKNNDTEEQIADLFGSFGRIELEIKSGNKKVGELDAIDLVLYNRMKQQLFKGNAVIGHKQDLYKEINSFVVMP